MTSALVAVQIVNYKTKTFLPALISSVLADAADSGVKVEINILDNASGDDLSTLTAQFADSRVRVTYAERNVGFGAGHNRLAAQTNADYLLILNPDLLFIEPRTLARLLQSLTETKAAVVGPRLLTVRERTTTPLAHPDVQQLVPQAWDHGRRSIWRFYEDHERLEVAWVSGAVFCIERAAFQAIGGFDERFFLYYEELDVCTRLRAAGQKVVYDPSIQVLHYGSVVATKASKHALRSFLLYQRKHAGLRRRR